MDRQLQSILELLLENGDRQDLAHQLRCLADDVEAGEHYDVEEIGDVLRLMYELLEEEL